MLKIDFHDGDCGGHLGFSITSFSYFVSHKRPNAHHQVSIQLDYRGDAQNMNSQHFSHINVQGPYKCMEKQIWPCRKKVKRQCRTIIWSPIPDLYKDKAPGLIWFWRRRFLKVFTIYGHGSHLCQWTVTILAIFRSPNLRGLHIKFEQH